MMKKAIFSIALGLTFILSLSLHAEESRPISLPEYNLSVSFDIEASKILGHAQIHALAGSELIIHTGELNIIHASANGSLIDLKGKEKEKIVLQKDGVVEIVYEAEFRKSDDNIIDKRGIVLRGTWYPFLEGMSFYRLKAALPDEYTAISEAERVIRDKRGDVVEHRFDFPYPLNDEDGISLIASKNFIATKDSYNGIEITAYLFPEEAHFAKMFIEHTKRYLKTYEKLLGRYPFKRLSIVEHFEQAGYSMPSYIFLGKEDFKLPIEKSPLGHEIVHQWFGNYVYTAYNKGNWNEGLTIYFADHSYDEQKASGWKCRRRILSGYKSHVKGEVEFPLREFSERYDFASRSIGYGKAAMVVHMLRKEVGDKLFYSSIRDFIKENRFKVATWDDIRKSFEKNTGRDLSWFFNQWVENTGTPELSIDNIRIKRLKKHISVDFDLIQKTTDFRLPVPVSFYSKGKKTTKIFTLDKSRGAFSIILPEKPDEIVIDEGYDLFRELTHEEDPPTLERLASEDNKIVVMPPQRKGMYADIVDVFNEKGKDIELAYMKSGIAPRKDYSENEQRRHLRFSMKNRDRKKQFFSKEMTEINDEAMKNSSIVVLGVDNPVIEKLFGKTGSAKNSGSPLSIEIKKNPRNPEKVVAIINVIRRQKTSSAFKEIFEYPFYSSYYLKDGQVIKKLQEMPRGIRFKIDLKETM